MLTDNEQFHFFWHGPFSQWHIQEFSINGITYNCCEQYMMAHKALLFGDVKSHDKIMNEYIPKNHKALGRGIQGFDANVWQANRFSIVLTANIAKFSQNEDLKSLLLNTGLDTIVEASPYDKIWGIGLSHKLKDGSTNPIVLDRNKWNGFNLLGQALVTTREVLKCQELSIKIK